MSRRILLVVLPLVLSLYCVAQTKLGTWRMYMPYTVSKALCDGGDKVYVASNESFFTYEKSSGVIQTYDKATGLSDISIKAINYDKPTKALVVAYNNSNVDLIFDGTDVYNIPDIKKKAVTGAINIHSISFYNGDAYLSNDMGISIINLARKEISNTYIIGAGGNPVKVYATTCNGSHIYAATETGVKYAPLSGVNLLDFSTWQQFGAGSGLPAKKASLITAYNNKIYTVVNGTNNDTLFAYDGNSWSIVFHDSTATIQTLDVNNNSLYFSVWDSQPFGGRLGKIDTSGSIVLRKSIGHSRPLNWFENNELSWETDFWNGFFKYDGSAKNIVPNGPFTANVFRMDLKNDVLNVAPGGVDESWNVVYLRDGFFIYKNGSWRFENEFTSTLLKPLSDIVSVASIPEKGKTYFGSYYAGIAEYDNNTREIKIHDKDNQPVLEGQGGDSARTKISCLTVDRSNNLWIGNVGATRRIKVLKNDGEWKDFSINRDFFLMKQIVFDDYDQLWAPLRSNQHGLLVWSYNGTLDDPSDDPEPVVLTTGEGAGGLPDAYVYTVAKDKDGNMWVGTEKGIAVYYCAGNVLTQSGCDADLIKVERDGFIGYLFGSESVRAIAVDAANRKWVGTTNGVWLISADGKNELLKFNTENSPLPTNQIQDIVINDKTGEVFIGTTGGIISYQGDATGDCTDCDGAIVYPNPIKPGYDGPIAIKGLTQDAYVKIVDVNGELVHQGQANGSQMVWDGKNYKGERARSGVYLVFSSTSLGKEKEVAKLLIMN